MKRVSTNKLGLTLVELLIVIAILAMLFQLLLPTIEASRESARASSCSNNLRQIGLAAQLHHNAHGHFPSGGWITMWVGDPLRGFGKDQPGGWIYNILPYVEANGIHRLPDDGDPERITDQQLAATAGMIQLPLPIMQCPSRRLPRAYPYILTDPIWDPVNSNKTQKVARSDYAANGGDTFDEDFPFFRLDGTIDSKSYPSMDKGMVWASTDIFNGICFVRSTIGSHHVSDGLSNTYLIGEKYLNPEHYKNGFDPGDNHSMYQGFDRDIIRWASSNFLPQQDQEGRTLSETFGSVHLSGLSMVFCDGSVRQIAYDIDPEIHRSSANRQDIK